MSRKNNNKSLGSSTTIFALLILLFVNSLLAQEHLTEQKAIANALLYNYSILIARNDSAIASEAATRGNAGMLPRLDLNAAGNIQGTSINQRFSNGLEVNTSGVRGNGLNASADLGWTLFDGGRMFINYNTLKTSQSLSDLQLKLAVENITKEVLVNYYDILRRMQDIKASEIALELANEQLLILEKKAELGSASRQEVLQAKIDKNEATSILMSQQTDLYINKVQLNRLMGINIDTEFSYSDNTRKSFDKSLEDISKQAEQSNSNLLFIKKQQILNEYNLKAIKAERLPTLSLNAAYSYNRTSSTAGFALFNQSSGPNAGLGITWNLFNGSQLNSRIKQSEFQLLNADLIIKDAMSILKSEVLVAYRQLLRFKDLEELERESSELAEENYKLALERLKLGQAGILAVKEASRSYENANSRFSDARFQSIQAEVELLRLAGILVK
jgi:outer membrane protein TolC